MKSRYDKEADAVYVELKHGKVHHTIEVRSNILIDVDKDGTVLGIEILNASTEAPQAIAGLRKLKTA